MKKFLAALAGTTAFLASHAMAQDAGPMLAQKDWFVKLGATYVMPDSYGKLGPATITAGNAMTVTAEAGYFVNDMISVSVTGGIPLTHRIYASGADTGTTDTLGAIALAGQIHLVNNDKFDLYVGGGLAYNIYFGTTSATTVGIDNGFAPVIQAGIEYKATDRIGLFVDAKKEFYTTTIHHIKAGPFQERLDPLAVTAGIAFHF